MKKAIILIITVLLTCAFLFTACNGYGYDIPNFDDFNLTGEDGNGVSGTTSLSFLPLTPNSDKPLSLEEIIYEIVDDIINTENKISEMTNSILINDNSNIGQTQFNLKHQILKNISQINSLNSELENKKNELIIFQKTNQKELKTIEIQIQ